MTCPFCGDDVQEGLHDCGDSQTHTGVRELTLEQLEKEMKERYMSDEKKTNTTPPEEPGPTYYPNGALKKEIEVTIKEAEVIKLNVQPGETLFFKFKGDDFFNDDVQRLGDRLRKMFKDNKVIVMTLPKDHDVELTTISENVTTEEEVKDCSIPTSYCNDCHCGKKEAIEGKKNE